MSDDETRVEAGGAQERPSGERRPPRALRPGDIVAHYRIVGPLGEGGSGAIYEARNIHHEGERVALKIVQPDIADRALFFDLLRAEASALQRVKHEAVVQYRTFGRLPDSDECFLVIEHVSGPTLAAAMRSAKLPEEAVRRLAIRLIDGLDAAHEQGIVHRDLSPDNVIMPDGDPDRATLIDFGIARSAAADPLGSKFAGKLSFAAPEQFADDPAQVGPWSDLYSLGLLLAAAARARAISPEAASANAVAAASARTARATASARRGSSVGSMDGIASAGGAPAISPVGLSGAGEGSDAAAAGPGTATSAAGAGVASCGGAPGPDSRSSRRSPCAIRNAIPARTRLRRRRRCGGGGFS